MARYFQLVTANKKDLEQVMWLLQNKTFYPETTSSPALPVSYNISFNYKQFFKFISLYQGQPVVKTREDKTDVEFGTLYVPTAEWTTRYGLSVAPTIVALTDDFGDVNGHKGANKSNDDIFLTYNYTN